MNANIGGAVSTRRLIQWFSAVSTILILWGVAFALFGLGPLLGRACVQVGHVQSHAGFLGCPIDRNVLLPWESALYGAIMVGWGTTLLFVGRIALRRRDRELMKPLLAGIVVWLLVEATFSVHYGVWFNAGVDVVVLLLFSVPLIASLRTPDAHTAG
jgi:hypothetical protein